MNNLREFFPSIEPYETGMLPVDSLHTMYWEQSGNPNGIPVVALHGGPGGGCHPDMRRFFDPAVFRIIMLDQRGCGKSTPHAELKDNTTQHLIADIELLRKTLEIEKWHIWGGSWGSTLALAYAQTHPSACLSLVLRGIFTMRQKEVDWFLVGMQTIFPEVWDRFAKHLPEDERDNILESYYQRLNNPDPLVHIPAAQHWSAFETSFSKLHPKDARAENEDAEHALAIARIEAHYFRNNLFQPDDALLQNLSKIHHIPCSIIQGRYDIICPPHTAWELHQNYPGSAYYCIGDAGHSSAEPGIVDALIRAIEEHIKL